MKNLLPFLNHHFYGITTGSENEKIKKFLNYLPKNTWKRKFIQAYLKGVIASKAYKLFPKHRKRSFTSALSIVEEISDTFFFYSQNLNKRERIYVFGVDHKEESFFAKIIWGKEIYNAKKEMNVHYFLGRELKSISHLPYNCFNSGDELILTYKILPKEAHMLKFKPEEIYGIFLRNSQINNLLRALSYNQFCRLDWWQSFKENINEPFYSYLFNIVTEEETHQFMFAHGDLGSENVFKHQGKEIIIDWEKSHHSAPKITDYLGIKLGNNSSSIIANKHKKKTNLTLSDFYTDNIKKAGFSYAEFLLGMSFYLGTNFNLADFLITDFEHESNIR